MSGDSTEEKTRPASARKLRKQREQGQVPQSRKMVSMATTAAGLGASLALLPGIVGSLAEFFDTAFRQMGTPLSQARAPMLDDLAGTLFRAVTPLIVVVTSTAVALTVLFHKGIPFSVKPLTPDFGRLNPASGLKQMLGKRSWIEASIGLVNIVLWVCVGGVIVWGMLRPMLGFHGCGLPCAAAVVEILGHRLVYAAISFLAVLIGLDMLVQRYLYAQDQRMTKSESKREQKENFGSREVRSERHRLRMEALEDAEAPQNAGVGRANMCFFTANNAVGILYHPETAPLPRVAAVARGSEATLAFRKIVKENGFREREDADIVESCLHALPGSTVPERAYKVLARGISRMFA